MLRMSNRIYFPGQQLVNHIPNGGCLTTKAGLLKSLQDYVRVYNRTLAGSTRYSTKFFLCELLLVNLLSLLFTYLSIHSNE